MNKFKIESLKQWGLNNIDYLHEQYYRQCVSLSEKSYIEIAYHLSLISKTELDSFIGKYDDFKSLSIQQTIESCPNIANYIDNIISIKKSIFHVYSPQKKTPHNNILSFVDTKEFCFQRNIVPIDFYNTLVFCCPNLKEYDELQTQFQNKSRENSLVTWCEINAIQPSFAISDSNLLRTSITNYKHKNATVSLVDLFLSELPEILQPLGEIISYCESNYIHGVNITVSGESIESLVYQDHIEGVSDNSPVFDKVNLYYSVKSFLSYLNLSLSDLLSKPKSASLNIQNLSSHTNEESELGIVIYTSPINDGFIISLNIVYSCEVETVINIKNHDLYVSNAPIVIYCKDNISYKSNFYQHMAHLFNKNKLSDSLLISENFPLVIGQARTVNSKHLGIEALRSYEAAGIANLIIGEINSPELAQLAVLGALSGLNILATMSGRNSELCKSNLKRLAMISTLQNANSLSIEDMVDARSTNGKVITHD